MFWKLLQALLAIIKHWSESRRGRALVTIVTVNLKQTITKQKSVSSEIYWIRHKTITSLKFAFFFISTFSLLQKTSALI